MSYDIHFRAKVEGTEDYVNVETELLNITWNVREIITRSTGLDWENEENNGLCTDVIPHIRKGLVELTRNGKKYKKYESPNGWGTVAGTINFFSRILHEWEWVCIEYPKEVTDKLTFWIM